MSGGKIKLQIAVKGCDAIFTTEPDPRSIGQGGQDSDIWGDNNHCGYDLKPILKMIYQERRDIWPNTGGNNGRVWEDISSLKT